MTTVDLTIRLLTAAVLGGAVGMERRYADKAAGLRTHMLVSMGSALFMIVSAHGFHDAVEPGRVVLDPSRVAAQVVSGIGFLGAGTIMRRKESVHGLTTAASVWAVAAVGLAAGGGMLVAAGLATALILATLTGAKRIEDYFADRTGPSMLSLLVVDGETAQRLVVAELARPGLEAPSVRFAVGDRPGTRKIHATLVGLSARELTALAARLQTAEGVLEVSCEGRTT